MHVRKEKLVRIQRFLRGLEQTCVIESGNVVCACVPVRVLIKGCGARYDIIPPN